MEYNYKEFTYPSGDGKSNIFACLYTPKNKTVRAVVQLVHGMCDYMGRYQDLAEALCDEGYAVCGNDHLGHGRTAVTSEEQGFFASEDGADTVITDVHKLTLLMRSQWSGSPVILLGHSMGSLIARAYAVNYYKDIDGAIFLGTTNSSIAGIGKLIARNLAKRKGETYRSPFLDGMVFGSYNKKFDKNDRLGRDWLTRDEEVASRSAIDPYCNFTFTVSAYFDLFNLVGRVSSGAWAKAYPKSLPTLVMAGECDPVGHMGRDPRAVATRLKNAGASDVTLKMYEGARHELFNETCRETFATDLIAWLNERY